MSINMITFLLILVSIVTNTLVFGQNTGIQGEWHVLHSSIGISAMHMQVLHNNKLIMFDRTDFGHSNISLPYGRCRHDPHDSALETDCTAHSVLYDIDTNTFRALMVQTDTWCSSGAVLPNGTLIQIGGFNDGDRVVRSFTPCVSENCDWVEFPRYLIERRWYASNQILPNGRIIVVGGRRQFNYEFYPQNQGLFRLDFLAETNDESENNLYPYLHLLPDGNLFIFANTRSILLDYNNNRVVKEYPRIPGNDPRNYPSTGSSVLLPLDENLPNVVAEIMVCGGAPRDGFRRVAHGSFGQALSTCGRLNVSDENPNWVMEEMPIARVMGDMLLLPTGDVIIINGARLGTAGWENGHDPIRAPVIYSLSRPQNGRFSFMAASQTPRLYHSAAVLIPDGRVIVGGSNPHEYYNFTGVEFPTELSLEAFSPPYLAEEYAVVRPRILSLHENIGYSEFFTLMFSVPQYLSSEVLTVRIVAPSFTTHSFSMNQRMVVLKLIGVEHVAPHTLKVTVRGPSTAEIAPQGYYMLFVVHAEIPSSGVWVKVQ
ncbi:aldehyde oxidase GLOX-like [Fagus crenata]